MQIAIKFKLPESTWYVSHVLVITLFFKRISDALKDRNEIT